MKDLRHTGDSVNIAYYAEPTSKRGDIWCEVLRSDFMGRPMVLRPKPWFYITVYRVGTGEVTRCKYRPRSKLPPGPLPDAAVTRLVRQALRGK